MSQTIQIKRSSVNTIPSSLAAGELAYSFKSGVQKLYVGDGSNVLEIGGKSFTDKLNGIAANANNYTLPAATATTLGGMKLFSNTTQTTAANSVTSTASRTYGVQFNSSGQAVVNVPWVDTQQGYTLPLATSTVRGGVELFSDTDQTVAANAVTTTASRTYGIQLNSNDQMVVNVPWTDTNTTFTAGTGLGLTGTQFSLDVATASALGGVKIGSGITITNGVISADEVDASAVSAAGAMMRSGGTFTGDVTFEGDNYNIVFDKSDDALEFGDGASAKFGNDGDLKIFHSSTVSYIQDVGTGNLDISTNGTDISLRGGNNNSDMLKAISNDAVEIYHNGSKKFESTSSGIDVTGEVKGDSLNIDGAGDISGNLEVHGNLTVNGTTTTVDSETVTFKDNLLLLNSNVTGTPSGQAGLEVERGTSVNAFIVWNETTDRWSIGLGSNASPNVLDTSTLSALNVENVAIDGGSF